METKVIPLKRSKNRGSVIMPPTYIYTVNWHNVTHIERLKDNGCKVFFIGGNFIIVDRKFDEVDRIAKEAWKRK
jgi:hypothetical protein